MHRHDLNRRYMHLLELVGFDAEQTQSSTHPGATIVRYMMEYIGYDHDSEPDAVAEFRKALLAADQALLADDD